MRSRTYPDEEQNLPWWGAELTLMRSRTYLMRSRTYPDEEQNLPWWGAELTLMRSTARRTSRTPSYTLCEASTNSFSSGSRREFRLSTAPSTWRAKCGTTVEKMKSLYNHIQHWYEYNVQYCESINDLKKLFYLKNLRVVYMYMHIIPDTAAMMNLIEYLMNLIDFFLQIHELNWNVFQMN